MTTDGDPVSVEGDPEAGLAGLTISAEAPAAISHGFEEEPPSLRTPLKGFLRLATGQGVGQVLAFVVLTLVARKVGPSNFGTYQFAFSALTYFTLLANLGVANHAVRDVSVGSHPASAIAGEVLVIRFVLAVFSYCCLLALAPYVTPSHGTAVILEIIGIALIFEAATGEWVLQATQHFGKLAVATLFRQMTAAALVFLFLTGGFVGVERYAKATVAGALVATAITAIAAIRLIGLPHLTASPRRLYGRFRRSIPFSWSVVMIQVYYTTDFLIIGALKGTKPVGQYGVAYRLPTIVISVILVWGSAAYPYLARQGARDVLALRAHIGRATSVALIIAASLVAITLPLGRELIVEIFGAAYAPAGTAFVILMANAGVVVASVDLVNVLLAARDERRYAIAVTVGAIVNTALNFALIPGLGIAGAATATLFAELTVFSLIITRARKVTGSLTLETRRITRGVLAAAVTCGGLFALRGTFPAVAEAAVGAVALIGLAIAFGAITPSELRMRRTPGGDAEV